MLDHVASQCFHDVHACMMRPRPVWRGTANMNALWFMHVCKTYRRTASPREAHVRIVTYVQFGQPWECHATQVP